jgi:hypothetical protein
LKINSEVVLFLSYISETGGYKPSDPLGSFELIDSAAHPLTAWPFPNGAHNERADIFLNLVRSISKN